MPQRKLEDWIKAYAEYTAESDSPQIFHMWCCLGTIAAAAQRKIYMQSLHFPVHTNMYTLLVSPPGRGRKTSALRTSKNLVKAMVPEANFASESGSFEGIVDMFIAIPNPAHQSLSLYSSELGTLMATNPALMVDFLTDIYDCNENWTRVTLKGGKKVIKRPWLNIMAGTTPRWLGEHMGLLALEGGLIARCIITYSEELILRNAWPEETPGLKTLREALIHDLSVIAMLDGEMKFDGGKAGEAYKWYDAWYQDHSRYPSVSDPRTASYFDRKHIHLLKVAMALSLSYKDELVLTYEDLMRAKALLEASEPGMRLALNAVGKNDAAVESFHVLSQIKANRQGIPYSRLLMENYHNLKYGRKSLDQTIDELKMMGMIRQEGNLLIFSGVT